MDEDFEIMNILDPGRWFSVSGSQNQIVNMVDSGHVFISDSCVACIIKPHGATN